MTIVIGSTAKGLVAGVLIGVIARKVNNLAAGIVGYATQKFGRRAVARP